MKNESEQNKKELKASDSETYRMKIEERRRMAKNFHGIAHENVSEALRKHLGLDFFSFFLFSSLISSESLVQKLLDP